MGEVVELGYGSATDVDANSVLDKAKRQGLKQVMVFGYDEEGIAFCMSNMADPKDINWLVDKSKKLLIDNYGGF